MSHPDPSQSVGVPLFAGLSDAQLSDLAEHLEVEEFEAWHPPARSGNHGYAFFVLADGIRACKAAVDGRMAAHHHPQHDARNDQSLGAAQMALN
jgi:hypothetical protein